MKNYQNINEYITNLPENKQKLLQSIRQSIHEAVPEAEEAIRYGMPTFRLKNKNMIHFAAFEHHIGLYPTPSGIESFQKDLSIYKQGKGSVQFPLDKPMPLELVKRIAKFRAKEVLK